MRIIFYCSPIVKIMLFVCNQHLEPRTHDPRDNILRNIEPA